MNRLLRSVAMAALVGSFLVPTASLAQPTAPEGACEWTSFRNGLDNHGASACDVIGPDNVSTLVPRSLYRTRDSVTATPAVVDGRLYVGAWDGTFYAFDTASSGVGDPSLPGVGSVEPAWTYQIDDTNGVSFGRIVSSATVTDPVTVGAGPASRFGRLVLFTGGASLYVLGADDLDGDGTGDLIASICLDPRSEADAAPERRCGGSESADVESEASPVVVPLPGGRFRVLVGTDVHNSPAVGRTGVTAVDLNLHSGRLEPVWKYDPEGDGVGDVDGATYRPDTHGDIVTFGSGTGDGCGGVWGTPAVDVDTDLVVLGISSCRSTSDPGPDGLPGTADDDADAVPGEKVYAISLRDGSFRWRFSPTRPWGSRTDDDFGASPQLFRIDPDGDGVDTLVAGAGGKDGWYFALDARDGAELWSTHFGQSGHTYEDFAIGGVLGSPAVGLSDGRQAIFVTTAISTPVGAPVDYGSPESIDESLAEDPARLLSLHALDASTGAVIWRQPLTRQTYAHPTFTNGIVLVPSTAGLSVQAFDADDGTVLWVSPLNGPPSSGVAVAGDSIYLGTGTRQTDAGFKLFGTDSSVPAPVQALVPAEVADLTGSDPQQRVAGIWAFTLGLA